VLVTGAAEGSGRATVTRLLAEAAWVAALDRRANGLAVAEAALGHALHI
jgi:NAD(P)-dependent dehydrogenase (short-subunit alcohol dehydrogenase family)